MSTLNFKIEYFVSKDAEKTYIKIPFTVPYGAESVEISYSYEGQNVRPEPFGEKNVIDLGLVDNLGNDISATGSAHRSLFVSETHSSCGAKKTALAEGVWHILLGAYMVKKSGVTVSYNVKINLKVPRWLRGDTHLHSTNSDGNSTYLQLAKKAKRRNLDYIIFTDHNNTFSGSLPDIKGLTMIKGVEFTHFKGHFNFLGAEKPYSGTYAINSFEEFEEKCEEAKKNGALRVINHPVSPCPWEWTTDFDYDGIEVWNGSAVFIKDTFDNLKIWDSELKKGKNLFAVGGSDYHRFSFPFAMPTTAVFADSRAESDILSAIKSGKTSILFKPNTPLAYIEKISETEIKVTCERLKRGRTLVILSENGEMFKHKAKRTASFSITLPAENSRYFRAEVRRKPPFKLALLDYLISGKTRPNEKNYFCKESHEVITGAVFFK
ncbi:MAG: CehA/McbA family metallohydrolase [Firmicutes bacterium]|nr:CehA/McbA family metallohydrolase [Bacillota bacterium]